MKKVFIIIISICALVAQSQNVNIPDPNFKDYLVNTPAINTNGDAEIQISEAQAFTDTIDCRGLQILDLTGIEKFTQLTGLDFSENYDISNIDLSKNTKLIYLNFSGTHFSKLDLSNNTLLKNVIGYDVNLQLLDLSNSTALVELWCEYVDTINLNNTTLVFFNMGNTYATTVNVTNNNFLEFLGLNCGSSTETLNIINNIKLTDIGFCEGNWFGSINIDNTGIDELHFGYSGAEKMRILNNNHLTSLYFESSSISDSLVLSNNPNLRNLFLHDSEINNIGCDNFESIKKLEFFKQIDSLKLSDFTGLEELNCYGCNLEYLDIYNNTELTDLYCNENQLTSLDLSNNTKLINVDCSNNSLTSLNLPNSTSLISLYLSNNKLDSIDISQYINLEDFDCSNNELTDLNIIPDSPSPLPPNTFNNLLEPQSSNLKTLFCNGNKLTSLNVANGNNSNMTSMDAKNNPDLGCIQHDEGFTPSSNWLKDDAAVWSTDCASALSIELSKFTAKTIDKKHVQLDWQTVLEIDNEYFEVERSTNAVDWETIKRIKGAEHSNSIINYQTIDKTPYNGISYYRLQQKDKDGKYYYSNIEKVQVKTDNQIQIFPNPAKEYINVYSNNNMVKNIRILCLTGQDVTSITTDNKVSKTYIEIDISGLHEGIYFIEIDNRLYKFHKQ